MYPSKGILKIFELWREMHQHASNFIKAFVRRPVKSGVAVDVALVQIGTVLYQINHSLHTTVLRSDNDRAAAIRILGIDILSVIEKEFYRLELAVGGSPVDWPHLRVEECRLVQAGT